MNIQNTYNRKGANSYTTTGNPILDLFLHQNIIINDNSTDNDYIDKLIVQLENAFEYNPELYCKCLLFHRQKTTNSLKILSKNTIKGNGYKLLFYLGMIVLRYKNLDIYKEMLVQSIHYGYFKDILRLLKIVNNIHNNKITFFNHINTNYELDLYQSINQFEIQLYSDLLYTSLINIREYNNVISMNYNINPFLFKYISSEKGTFNKESKQIWNYTEYLLNKSN